MQVLQEFCIVVDWVIYAHDQTTELNVSKVINGIIPSTIILKIKIELGGVMQPCY
jgi:hypothetical protein